MPCWHCGLVGRTWLLPQTDLVLNVLLWLLLVAYHSESYWISLSLQLQNREANSYHLVAEGRSQRQIESSQWVEITGVFSALMSIIIAQATDRTWCTLRTASKRQLFNSAPSALHCTCPHSTHLYPYGILPFPQPDHKSIIIEIHSLIFYNIFMIKIAPIGGKTTNKQTRTVNTLTSPAWLPAN